MGILEFLSKERRHARWIDKQVRRANNKHTPKDYRQIALQNVIEHARKGDEAALRGMIQRFAIVAEPTIEDEREKEWICDALIDFGELSLPHIKRSLRSSESVSWILRALKNIVDQADYQAELLDALSDFDTEYERNPDRKIQIIMAMAEISSHEVAEALTRFLDDVDETVRFQTVVALSRQEDEATRDQLLKVMCEDESIRVRNEVVDSFARLGWSTSGFKKKIESVLPKGYKHDKSGKIIKLGD